MVRPRYQTADTCDVEIADFDPRVLRRERVPGDDVTQSTEVVVGALRGGRVRSSLQYRSFRVPVPIHSDAKLVLRVDGSVVGI